MPTKGNIGRTHITGRVQGQEDERLKPVYASKSGCCTAGIIKIPDEWFFAAVDLKRPFTACTQQISVLVDDQFAVERTLWNKHCMFYSGSVQTDILPLKSYKLPFPTNLSNNIGSSDLYTLMEETIGAKLTWVLEGKDVSCQALLSYQINWCAAEASTRRCGHSYRICSASSRSCSCHRRIFKPSLWALCFLVLEHCK